MRNSLPGGVAKAGSSRYRDALEGGVLLPLRTPVQEGRHGPGEPPGAGVEPGLDGQGQRRGQHVMLGFEPGQRLLVARQLLGRDPVQRRAEADGLT